MGLKEVCIYLKIVTVAVVATLQQANSHKDWK